MQHYIEGSVDSSPRTQSMYDLSNLDSNNIKDEGCAHLSQSQWRPPYPQIRYWLFYLEYNNIGAKGCAYLTKAQWNKLHTLDIGKSSGIEVKTILEL